MAGLCIGTSGWSYDCWRNDFYAGIPRKHWLRHYASRFSAVEINASFYGRQHPTTLARWAQDTPPEFRFALKAQRFLTHTSKLFFSRDALWRERDAAVALGDKLAVVIWQTPATLSLDFTHLQHFTALLGDWPDVRHALELRHDTWFCAQAAEALSRYRVAVVQSDAAAWPLWDAVTTDLVYVRLHGHEQTYASAYTDSQLHDWASRIGQWLAENRTVHVYFDNTEGGHAWQDAQRLQALLGV